MVVGGGVEGGLLGVTRISALWKIDRRWCANISRCLSFDRLTRVMLLLFVMSTMLCFIRLH